MNDSEVKKCIGCEKDFRIIPQELDFYNRKSLPIPKNCSFCRRKRKINLRNKKILYERSCDKCKILLKSTYPSDSKYIVYCEKCYINSIN